MKLRQNGVWALVLCLVALEQGIKLAINRFGLDADVPIVPGVLYFRPVFNRDYSWFNSMLGLNNTRWLHVALTAALTVFMLLFYLFLRSRVGEKRSLHVIFAFAFSGALCSVADKLFWNGSLDYIQLRGFFTFDLKDLYINVLTVSLLALILFNEKAIRPIFSRTVFQDFLAYFRRKPT